MEDEFTLSTVIPRTLNEEFEVACIRRQMKKKPAVAEALREWIAKDVSKPVEKPVEKPPIAKRTRFGS